MNIVTMECGDRVHVCEGTRAGWLQREPLSESSDLTLMANIWGDARELLGKSCEVTWWFGYARFVYIGHVHQASEGGGVLVRVTSARVEHTKEHAKPKPEKRRRMSIAALVKALGGDGCAVQLRRGDRGIVRN